MLEQSDIPLFFCKRLCLDVGLKKREALEFIYNFLIGKNI